MWKSIFLISLFALLLCFCALIYVKISQEDDFIKTENKTLSQFHDYSNKNQLVTENDFNIKVLYFEEKYNSVNKRFDDLYILGSIIVLLLITINIGLFVNTQNKVDKYFSDNFTIHQRKAEDIAKNAGEEYGKLLTMIKNLEKLSNQKEETVVLQEQESLPPQQ